MLSLGHVLSHVFTLGSGSSPQHGLLPQVRDYVRKTRTPWRRAWTRPGSMDMLNVLGCKLFWVPTVHTRPCSAAWRTMTVSLLAITVFRMEMTNMGNTKDMKVLTCKSKRQLSETQT